MKNVKFRGKKTNSAVKFCGSIPRQKPKFRGSARNSTGRGKLWALLISVFVWLLYIFFILTDCLLIFVVISYDCRQQRTYSEKHSGFPLILDGFYAFLGFYKRNGFILWRLNPEKLPNMPMSTAIL